MVCWSLGNLGVGGRIGTDWQVQVSIVAQGFGGRFYGDLGTGNREGMGWKVQVGSIV